MKRYPVGSDNLGWSRHYQKLYNQTLRETAAQLAMWYLLLHLMHND